jgi:hypothetical protein
MTSDDIDKTIELAKVILFTHGNLEELTADRINEVLNEQLQKK